MEKLSENNLPAVWKAIEAEYVITKYIGAGSFGEVVQAKCKKTAKKVAIKLIKGVFKNNYTSKKVLREITILRKLA